ncbi:MAG: regulatory protein GemA [Trichloromonadaceae bacterium]
MGKAMIMPSQVKRIHILKSALGLDDPTYRAMLFESCQVESSKQLTASQAAVLICDMEDKAVAAGCWVRHEPAATSRREGFASPAQIAMIKSLWDQVSTSPPELRSRALRRFVARQAKVSDLRFLRDSHASRVICALQAMQRQHSTARSA